MIGYTVVTAESAPDLIVRVNEMIRVGWSPLAGVAHTPGHQLSQAMIREDQTVPREARIMPCEAQTQPQKAKK